MTEHGRFGDVGWIGAHDYLVKAEPPSDWPDRLPVDLAGVIQCFMKRRSPGSNDGDASQARLPGVDANGFDAGHANACDRFAFTHPVRDFGEAVSEIRSLAGRNDHGFQEERR